MGFLTDRGPVTNRILEKLRKVFFEDVDQTALQADLFNPNQGYSLSYIASQIGALPAAPDEAALFIGWLDDLQQNYPNVHKQIRKKMHNHLTRTPPRPILHDWEESTATKTAVHFLDDFWSDVRRKRLCYMRVSTVKVTAAKKAQYRRIAKKLASKKKSKK